MNIVHMKFQYFLFIIPYFIKHFHNNLNNQSYIIQWHIITTHTKYLHKDITLQLLIIITITTLLLI